MFGALPNYSVHLYHVFHSNRFKVNKVWGTVVPLFYCPPLSRGNRRLKTDTKVPTAGQMAAGRSRDVTNWLHFPIGLGQTFAF